MKRQARNYRRDGALVALGLGALAVLELAPLPGVVANDASAVHGFLSGCAIGVLVAGVFRAPDRQVVVTALAFGVGFAVGTVVDVI